MVKRSASPLLSVALVLYCSVQVVESAPIQYNPYTPVGDVVALDRNHPAFGAQLPTTSVALRPMVRMLPDSLADLLVTAAASGNATSATASTNSERASMESFGAGVVITANYDDVVTQRQLEGGGVTNEDLARLETHFGAPLEYTFSALPRRGAIDPIPWPSSYWPVFQDSINYKWDKKQASPAEKYAKAFKHDVKAFMTRVSEVNGVASQRSKKACSSDWECLSVGDGSTCAKREGEPRGFCIPTWFGICHAWAPAAILEPEPKCPVTKNGVTFQPFDIKALVSMTYDGASLPTVFTGSRFNGKDASRDQFGRYKDVSRRDIGAGYFHIAVSNMLGLLNHTFVVDVTAGAEVWNQPVRSFEVLEARPIDAAQAGRTYFKTNSYPFNPSAASLRFVKTRFQWIVESSENGALVQTKRVDKSTKSAEYTYILELDASERIIGGEWVDKSQENHPDFLWFPTAKPAIGTVTDVGIAYREVAELLESSVNGRC